MGNLLDYGVSEKAPETTLEKESKSVESVRVESITEGISETSEANISTETVSKMAESESQKIAESESQKIVESETVSKITSPISKTPKIRDPKQYISKIISFHFTCVQSDFNLRNRTRWPEAKRYAIAEEFLEQIPNQQDSITLSKISKHKFAQDVIFQNIRNTYCKDLFEIYVRELMQENLYELWKNIAPEHTEYLQVKQEKVNEFVRNVVLHKMVMRPGNYLHALDGKEDLQGSASQMDKTCQVDGLSAEVDESSRPTVSVMVRKELKTPLHWDYAFNHLYQTLCKIQEHIQSQPDL